MNEIKITTELCQEDRYRLDLIIQLLGQHLTPASAQTCVSTAAQHPVVNEPFDTTPVPPAAPAPDPTSVPPAAPKYAKTDVQAAIVRLVTAGKKAEARAVIKSYAASVSALPEGVIDEVMQQLQQLEGASGQSI